MKPLLPVVAACAMLTGVGAAYAQDVIVVPAERPDVYVVQPEQRMVIREYVREHPVPPADVLGPEIRVGSRVPETVVLHEIPETEYRYLVVDEQTVVVDPETNEIIDFLY